MASLAYEHGIPLVIIPTPEVPARNYFEPLYQAVTPLFEQAGIKVYDPLDLFLKQYPNAEYNTEHFEYFIANPTNAHPGPATSWFLAFYHDSAAAILRDGEIVAAAQEERFSRIKGDASFPHNAVNYCLLACKASIEEVDEIVFYEDPLLKFERLLQSQHWAVPRSLVAFLYAMPKWLTENLWLEKGIAKEIGVKKQIHFRGHHMSHAAGAFYPSPFGEAAILTVDGVGAWSTAAWGIGSGNRIKLIKHMTYPNSLGLLYSAFTLYCGFKINSGEYKLMGLAPYGEPRFAGLIKRELICMADDGSFAMNQKYFGYTHGIRTINKKFEALFGQSARAQRAGLHSFIWISPPVSKALRMRFC